MGNNAFAATFTYGVDSGVGSSLTLLIESTPPGKRGVASGLFNVGVYAAVVFASLAALAVNTLLLSWPKLRSRRVMPHAC